VNEPPWQPEKERPMPTPFEDRPVANGSPETEAQTLPPPSAVASEGEALPPTAPYNGAAPAADSLATMPPSGDFPATPPPGPTGQASGPPIPAPPGYEILGELGRGGMGVVYRARQIALGRTVALKMILAGGHADEAHLSRFQTEAEAIARLQHPNIVAIYEIGKHQGQPFISLEYCEGGSLDDKLRGNPLPADEAARLTETLARAVHAAHQANVIHRDLKPANVLLSADGTPRITDFGLAKKLDEAGQTQSGDVVGTPSYMAPEQAAGRVHEAGPPADVYSLGAILYELLTGRPPFKAATALDTVVQVLTQEPVPPRQLNAKIPLDLDTICLKCLEKQAARRYPSALQLAEELRRHLDHEPILARPTPERDRWVKWTYRQPYLALAVYLLVLLASVLTASVMMAPREAVVLLQRAWGSAGYIGESVAVIAIWIIGKEVVKSYREQVGWRFALLRVAWVAPPVAVYYLLLLACARAFDLREESQADRWAASFGWGMLVVFGLYVSWGFWRGLGEGMQDHSLRR
jgi:hypothetical protein